jgi:ribosomal protein L11 methyltransferase
MAPRARSRSSSASKTSLDNASRAACPALDLRFESGPASDDVEAQLYAALDDFQPIAIQEHASADGWRVFFRDLVCRDQAALALRQSDIPCSVTPVDVPDEDWARRSQASLTAITVGRIIVAPPWDVPNDTDHIVIVIDPSMGFGTGHHQTTRLCLSLLQSADLAACRVIDVGTGSGVLAIAAAKLGATSVIAMDNDPDAAQNARENVGRNGGGVEVVQADLAGLSSASADVVIANMTGAVLQRHASVLRGLVASRGMLIVSGFSPEELTDVVAALEARALQRVVEDEWAAAMLRL